MKNFSSVIKPMSMKKKNRKNIKKTKRITLATSCKELTHWKRPWCWEGLRAGAEGETEDEMAGWHHQLNGHEFGWTPGVGDGQGGLACCDSWGHKELDMTERLNWVIETYRVSMDVRKTNTTIEKTIQVQKQDIYKRQTVTKSVIKGCIKAIKYQRMVKLWEMTIINSPHSFGGKLMCVCKARLCALLTQKFHF